MLNAGTAAAEDWRPPVVMIGNIYEPVAFNSNIDELVQKIEEHYQYLQNSGRLTERLNRKANVELNDALKAAILEPVLSKLNESGEMAAMVEKIRNRVIDPHTLAEEIARRFLK